MSGAQPGGDARRAEDTRPVSTRAAGAVAAALPARVGPFRILREIGLGGMGSVYLAEQDHPQREVALKVIRAEAFGPKLLRRFELEAEMLGRLQHAGIAQIYQAGTHETPQGLQPYFAMEYVRGARIDEYVRERRLGTRARLELAARVCDALEHAHQKGIIHRDLKPGNILVTEEGQPKVLDFGVARLTDADVRTTTMHTDVGALVGTLSYMSPEQASGDPDELDTRSDVYSLGILAYELLTGRLPYQIPRLLPEAVRTIREEEPSKLSTHDQTLRGDVETIVLKALEKDKTRRYPSASALAADLRRFLADEPISARRPSTWYQLQKFTRRNRVLVGSAVAVFLALVAGTALATQQAVRARRAGREAQRQALLAGEQAALAREQEELARAQLERATIAQEKAEQAATFLDSLFAGIDPYVAQGADTTLLTRILGEAETRIAAELGELPEVEASIRKTLGKAQDNLGQFERAEPNLRRAEELFLGLFGPDDRRTLDVQQALASLFFSRGQHAQAEQLLRDLAERQTRVLGPDDPDCLETQRILGDTLTRQGEPLAAEQVLRAVLTRQRELLGESEPGVLSTKFALATALYSRGQLAEAEELFGEVHFERSRTLGEGDAHTLEALGNLALVLQAQERYDEAEEAEREALERMRATLGPENPQTLNVLNNLGACLREQGRAAEAEEIWRECLALRERVLGPRHVDTLRSLSSLAMLLLEQGRNQEAIPLLEQALAGQKELLGEDHQDTKSSKYRLAFLLKAEHRHAEAAVLLGEVAEHDQRSLGEDDPSYGIALYNWAGTLQDAGQTAEAERIFREVLELHARHGWLEEPYTAATLNGLAKVLEARGEHEEADALFQEALHLRRELFGRGELSYSLSDYGEVLLERRDYEGAEPLLRELVDIIPHVRRAGDWRIGSSQALLGRCLALQGRCAEAQPLLEAAAGALVNDAEAKPSVVENALDWLIELFERWHEAEPTAGHDQQAAAWRARRAARESTQ